MKTAGMLACVVAMAWLATAAPAGDPLYDKPVATRPASAPPAAARPAELDGYVLLIERSEDPRVAISAYARGLAVDQTDLPLHRAYVRRMAREDLPSLAAESARYLTVADPADGVAWAVLAKAYLKGVNPRLPAGAIEAAAREGGEVDAAARLTEAVAAIVNAVRNGRKDELVLKTAGEVLAAYNAAKGSVKLPEPVSQALKAVQTDLAGDPVFAAAYARAGLAAAGQKGPDADRAAAETLYVPPAPSDTASRATVKALDKQIEALQAGASGLTEAMRGAGGRYGDEPYSEAPTSSMTILNYGTNVYRPGVLFGSGVTISGHWSGDHSSGTFSVGSPWGTGFPAPSYYGQTWSWLPAYYGGSYYGDGYYGGGYLGGPPYYFVRHLPGPSAGPTDTDTRRLIRPLIGRAVYLD